MFVTPGKDVGVTGRDEWVKLVIHDLVVHGILFVNEV